MKNNTAEFFRKPDSNELAMVQSNEEVRHRKDGKSYRILYIMSIIAIVAALLAFVLPTLLITLLLHRHTKMKLPIGKVGDFKIVNKTIGYLFNPNNCYYITRKYGSLEIKKIDLNVSSNSVDRVYNGLPLTSETNGELHLNYDKSKILSNLGHHVESSFIYENRFDCLHSDNRFNFKILDSGNNDITDKYYNVSRSFGYLEITPKPLKIEVFNKQKIYDGTALQVDMSDISVDGLVDTDTFILDNANSVIMPTLDNPVKELIDYRIIHSNGADVLSNYDIDFSTGYYKVDKIKIEISTNSISSSYDGRLFSDSANDETHKLKSEIEYVNSGLLEGHELRTSFINNNFYVTPDGTNVENRLDYAIYEKGTALEVENWQDIYDIKTYFGWLKVSKQNLSVSATSERVYGDGTLTLDDLNVTGLIDDIDQISFSGSIFEDPDAVATSSTFTYEITNKITGEDFSNCYNVDIDFTSFIKNPRSIVVDMPGGEIMYDGGYHSYNLSGGEPSISPTSPYSLLPNHTLSLVTRGGITSAGNYVVGNNFNSTQYGVQIYNEEDADVTFNYQIVYNYAPITIRKRNISINIDNDYLQAEFNGKSIFNNVNFNDYFSVVGDGLAPNENLGPISEGPIAPGSGTYQLQVGIYLENYSTTHNYEINVNQFNVSYSIDKIQNLIVETVGNVGKTYDGTTVVPDTNCSIEVVSPILYIDEIYDLSYSSSSPSVGTYEYDVDFTNAYFYNRSKREKIDFSDAVENVVVFNNATVEIQQRLIRFGFAKSFDTYNQDDNNVYQLPFRAEPYKYIPLVGGQNFAAGDSLELVNFTDVELSYIGDTATLGYSVDNIIIRNKNQEDVTDCYEIITENRLFEVIPGTVYINSLSNYQTYNRRDITYEEYVGNNEPVYNFVLDSILFNMLNFKTNFYLSKLYQNHSFIGCK